MKNRSFGGYLWEIAIFPIAIGLLRYYLGISIDLLKISPTSVKHLDQTIIKRQAFRVRFIDLRQIALFFKAIVELKSYWVGEKEGWEGLRIGVKEDMFGILVQLIGALRVISACVEFGLAGVVEGAVNALIVRS